MLLSLGHRTNPKARHNRSRVTIRPALHPLEDRTVPAVAVGLTSANTLVRFDTATPAVVTTVGPIAGLVGGDSIIGIDFRPATGELFGLGSGSRLYVINPTTGAAAQRGTDGAFTLSGA